jgi:hypothetical protein
MNDLALFHRFRTAARPHDAWREHLTPFDRQQTGCNLHLAIFTEPYLTLLLQGHKTVESRFSQRRCVPFGRVAKGDLIVLKRTGGPIVGLCRVRKVWSYKLTPHRLHLIQRRFSRRLGVQDDSFWAARRSSAYATLIAIEGVTALPAIRLAKRDRRGWVTLCGTTKPPCRP